ncbi:hypothetical protein BS78_K331300 [Paspalum vaginatum]|uniref:Fatty acyl-CoA reductase n=1 Tax=Paspalum vaginatum TaxID=158149 RepID=A0A9W8CEF7_9POAL|nr:hypothetical protein BS78_K331300 [Paspalum vaginatum]
MAILCTNAPSPQRHSFRHRQTKAQPLCRQTRPFSRESCRPTSIVSSTECSNGSAGRSTCVGTRPSPTFPAQGRDSSADSTGGIGITEFLGRKNFLIIGGTGFLAKILIEKILRANPDIGKIYIVIKAKDTQAALKRIQNEVAESELFTCLEEIHGKDYHSFLAKKLVPVVGDIREANLGIAPDLAHKIEEEVDVIVNSAGNTTFDERYDVAMDINTLGPFRIMSFAQRFQRLKLFLHVSTAYVNGQRQGVVMEKPFQLGDTIAMEFGSSDCRQAALLDIEAEVKLAFASKIGYDDSASISQEMKRLGQERAKLHGWQDVYVFSKAMGEMVINCVRGDIPVVTIRPSIIEGTLRDPFPGWIQGNRMMDPIVLNYGRGHITSFLADPDCVIDVIPADMVVNAMLASMAKHGQGQLTAGMQTHHVYHLSSSTVNPLVCRDLFDFFFQHFTRSPVMDMAGKPILRQPMRFCGSMEEYTSSVEVEANALLQSAASGTALSERRKRNLRAKVVENIVHLGRIYEPYTFYGCRFDNGNTEALLAEMSAEEREKFHFDVRSVDWMNYITDVHIPGLRKYVGKGT